MSREQVQVLLICGPPGVGKSTLGWEVGVQLRQAGVAHVVLDGDELDRAWPLTNTDREQLCRDNLASFWANAARLGHRSLILVAVFLDPDVNRPWITAAVPDAVVTRVVLDASDTQLERRVRAREIGSEAEHQLARTLAIARQFRHRRAPADHVLWTDAHPVAALAAEVIGLVGWAAASRPPAEPEVPTGARVTIREYRDADYSPCRALWVELTEHHRRIYADPTIGGQDPGAGFDDYLAAPARAVAWVAEVDDEVTGLTGLFDHGGSGEVEPVVVTEPLRGTGVGRALIDRVVAEARARGHENLTIRPVARNTCAIASFHAAGFRTLGGHIDLTMDLRQRRHVWFPGAHLHGLDFRY